MNVYECFADLNLASQITVVVTFGFYVMFEQYVYITFFHLFIWGRHRPFNGSGPKMAILMPWLGLVPPNWGKSVEQVWNKSGHIWGAAFESVHWSRVTMLQRAKKTFCGHLRPYGPGGFKLAEQCGTRWEQVRAHQVRCADEEPACSKNFHFSIFLTSDFLFQIRFKISAFVRYLYIIIY